MSNEQFKAYFLALLGDKEFTRIFDVISKVDKSFKRPPPYFRTHAQPGGNRRFSSPNPRVTCYRCGTPGHTSPSHFFSQPVSPAFFPLILERIEEPNETVLSYTCTLQDWIQFAFFSCKCKKRLFHFVLTI